MSLKTIAKHISFIIIVLALQMIPACVGSGAEQQKVILLKQKADRAVAMLNEKLADGCDVSEIIPKMKNVKTLGEQRKIEQAHTLLDEIFADFSALECGPDESELAGEEFINDRIVTIKGYDGDVMEAFISRDGKYLFFNDMETPEKNKDIFWAARIDDYTFNFMGEVKNINTKSVEGVPSMDRYGNFYFVSTFKYADTLVTIYGGRFDNGTVKDIRPLKDLSLHKKGWLNMGSEISADSQTLYSTQTYFGDGSPPTRSYFFYSKKKGDRFIPQDNSEQIFKEINKDDVVYGITVSEDELEILYTRLISGKVFQSLRAVRDSKNAPFKKPEVIKTITGFSEAPALTNDGKLIYYHKKGQGGKFKLHVLHRNDTENIYR